MEFHWPAGLGAIIAIIVIILCVLGVVGVLPASPPIIFGMIGFLAVARLT